MLQQTQVATVIPYYYDWLRRFPDFITLANAREQEILRAWQGLGYYTRARNLHATAQNVVAKHNGSFPKSLAAINELPGVGRYTANAVATFAFNQSVPVVEANITRLLARLFNLQIPIDTSMGRETLWQHARELLPARNARKHNSALMDLGALVCVARPNCPLCPVRRFCRAEKPAMLPIKRPPSSTRFLTESHTLFVRHGRILLEQSQNRWRGMWILPRLEKIPPKHKPLHISQFPFTNHRITLNVFRQRTSSRRTKSYQRWFPIDELDSIPLPSPHRRALQTLLSATSQ